MYTLFVDSDCDITKKEALENGCRFISMPYTIDDKTIFPYEDFDDFDYHEFYDVLRSGVIPSTSSISEEMYYQFFKTEFKAGKDILYAHFSKYMSKTFDNMDKAVERLKNEFPERKFYEIDTKAISLIGYNIILEIIDLYKQNKTPEEIISWANSEIQHFAIFSFVDDLKFFRKSGRVSNLSATMGTLVGIRPIISMTTEGKLESIGTIKGRAKAMEKLVNYVEELGDNINKHRVIICHTDVDELAIQLKEMLIEKFGSLNIIIIPMNPTAGCHCGPNTLAVSFHSIHR